MRPTRVREAVVTLDYAAAQAMSRAGGRATARNRQTEKRRREILEQVAEEKLQKEMYARAVEAGEDVCPID